MLRTPLRSIGMFCSLNGFFPRERERVETGRPFVAFTFLLWCRLDNVVADLPYTLIMRFHCDSRSM